VITIDTFASITFFSVWKKKTLATASPAKFSENMFENQRMKQSKAK